MPPPVNPAITKQTRRCRCGGKSLLVKKFSSCTLFKYFRMWWFTHRQNCEVQKTTGLICSRSTLMRFLVNHYWEKTKTKRANGCRLAVKQPPSSGINVLRDYVTIYNQRHEKLSKRKNRDQFFPTFICLGNTARQLQLLHPSAEEFIYTGRDRNRGCPREYTHIHMGIHEDIERRGKKRDP